MSYGAAPDVVGEFVTPNCEMMFVLYLPVRLAGQREVVLPLHVEDYRPLVEMALKHEGSRADGRYVYLTVKRLWVEPNCLGGRLGWHTDGFGTNDVNYIWADADPTEFCVQAFSLSDDHELSMQEMKEQARSENIVNYDPCDVIRIDARHVHRCPEAPKAGYRTFARVSISDSRYDMVGNAHNHALNYNWIMHPRGAARNDTSAQAMETRQGEDAGQASSDKMTARSVGCANTTPDNHP